MSSVASAAPVPAPLKRKCRDCPTIVEYPTARCHKCRIIRQEKRRAESSKGSKPVMKTVDVNVTQGGAEKKKRKERDEEVDSKKKKKQRLQKLVENMPVSETGPSDLVLQVKSDIDKPEALASASEMHKRLKKLSSTWQPAKRIHFHASFSVVAESKKPDNEKQAELFARDISKVAGVPFNHKASTGSHCGTEASPNGIRYRRYSQIFPCNCASNEVILKNSKAGLTTWLSSQLATGSKTECGGYIEVGSTDDDSHPLKIPGQKITVRITHPGLGRSW
ncbi:hypothetical protein VNI00_006480 [Paramarasmius palmivorus]|uniref:Uncharacterized protein n=1 Tax=Paramarasmius palmivorus TaxID=297713 RepID=A0AAW0D8D2_9AGAR